MMTARSPRILITGASGHLGRRVLEILLEQGVTNLCAGTRTPDKVSDLAAMGAELRRVDFDEPGSLRKAFEGTDRLLIISTDAIFVPGQRRRQHRAALDAALEARVGRLLYTSMPNPEPPSVMPIAPDHYEMEQAIEQSARSFAILRNSWYAENLLRSMPAVIKSGRWYTSAADGRIPYISREDVARATAAALLDDSTSHVRYDLTGARALCTQEIATLANDVFGSRIEIVPVSDDELSAQLAASGMPAAWVPRRVATDVNTRRGKFDVISDAVIRLTGSPPQTLREFFAMHCQAFQNSGA
jgi:NAD(P)H dehydrogenase (quinone)